jgi:mRNA interferase RelE/StbE
MTYELAFKTSALKEWSKLGHTVRAQFKKKLVERLRNPHVPSAALSGAVNIYKIKLRRAGYRLVYSVEDRTVTVTVVASRQACPERAVRPCPYPASSSASARRAISATAPLTNGLYSGRWAYQYRSPHNPAGCQ